MTAAERKAKGLTLARKEHRCDLCRWSIEAGEAYKSHKVGPWDGYNDEAATLHHHRFCDAQWDKATADWRHDEFQDCLPSTVLEEAILELWEEWGVEEEIRTILEWERMTKAARERWEELRSDSPLWVHKWIDAPRPDFNKVVAIR